jgi:hypothetical protein
VGGATTAAGLAGLIVAETKLYIYNLLVLDITKTKSESRQLPKFEKKNYLHTGKTDLTACQQDVFTTGF